MNLQDNIYRYRKAKGYSQEELAVLCHVSRQAVSKWENGSSKPDSDNLVLLAKYLEVSTDALLGLEEHRIRQQDSAFKEISYTSKLRIFNIPLVDIYFRIYRFSGFGCYRIGFDGHSRCAKGIIAIGTRAVGVCTLSFFGAGLFGVGLLNIGLFFSLGLCSVSLLYAIGLLSLSIYMAFGVIAIGMYAFGVVALGAQMAVGVVAWGNHAIGIVAEGNHHYLLKDGTSCVIDMYQYQKLQSLLSDTYMPSIMHYVISHLPLC